jgi:MFS family permease
MRDRWLIGVCVSRVLLYSNFMVYAACLAVVRLEWGISAAQAATVSSGFTVAYALSLVVFSTLADRLGARRVAFWSAWLSAATSLLFGLFAHSYLSALLLYSLVGLTQGGVYTPIIMLMADRYAPAARGAAVGWLIGSTSIGYAASLLVAGAALAWGGYRLAFLVTALPPAIGASILHAVLRVTPNRIHAPAARAWLAPLSRLRRDAMRLIGGYSAHSWELLGMWAWMPAFLTAALSRSGGRTLDVADVGAYLAAGLHLLGATAATSMGRLSDALGRRRVLVALGSVSAILSLSIGWAIAGPIALLVLMALVYSFAAIGDSPVLSAALTEVVEPGDLGWLLGLRSLVGFGAGAVSPWVFGFVLDASNPDGAPPAEWGWAFAVLGIGGIVATACAAGLRGRQVRER